MISNGIHRKFVEQISPDIYNHHIEKARDFLDSVEQEVLSNLKENYEFDILDHSSKQIVKKLIQKYIKEILTKYPNEKDTNRISRLGKKIYKMGLSDMFIISIFSMIKSVMKKREILSEVLEKRLEMDILLVLKPLTVVSMSIDKKIEKFTKIDRFLNDSIGIFENIEHAKKEHIRIKNNVIKDIFEDNNSINKISAKNCKLYKILKSILSESMEKSETYSQIFQVHEKFHDYINYYVENKEKLNSHQKYLLLKEIEGISLRTLFLLNQLQIEISNYFSFFDILTESYNKNIFPVILQKEIKRAERYNVPLTVSIIDIDNFKNINDTYGHLTGDEILKEISKLIKNSIRHSDYLFRFGGEEFILLLPHTDTEGAILATEKIRKKIEKSTFTEKQIKLTVSCGISEIKHFNNPYLDIEEADKMLYISKRNGKNRCTAVRGEQYEYNSISSQD